MFGQTLCLDADDDLLCDNRTCGNGIFEPALHEPCEDGNNAAGDGCDGACLEEDVVADVVSAGGTVTTDPGNAGASPAEPVKMSLEVPSAGPVNVVVTSATGGSGFAALGR